MVVIFLSRTCRETISKSTKQNNCQKYHTKFQLKNCHCTTAAFQYARNAKRKQKKENELFSVYTPLKDPNRCVDFETARVLLYIS